MLVFERMRRFKRHATPGTIAWSIAFHACAHGAKITSTLLQCGTSCCWNVDRLRRTTALGENFLFAANKLIEAVLTAKIKVFPVLLCRTACHFIDIHFANWINSHVYACFLSDSFPRGRCTLTLLTIQPRSSTQTSDRAS